MATSNATIIEGVDDEVLLAFLTLLVITILTVIYYLKVNQGAAMFRDGWVNLRTFISRQIASLSSSINQGIQSSNDQRTNHSTDQLHSNQSDNQTSGQYEETVRQTVVEHPEDSQRETSQDCPSQANTNSNSNESQGGGREEGRGSDDGTRQRTGFGFSSAPSSSDARAQQSGSHVSVRVKHHEVERSYTVDPNITVEDLKRISFPDEIAQGRRVRFVYSGRLLNDDNASISFYGISNYSVVHAQISDVPQQNSASSHDDEEIELDISRLFIPLLALILCACWYGLMSYRSLFTTTSTAILFVITAAYAFMVYVMFS